MMRIFRSSSVQCYCAFCRSPRKVYRKKRVALDNILGSLLGAGIIMFAAFRDFDPRAILIFVILLAASETFVQLRWRLAMVCKFCGFDPVLYLKDVGATVAKVQKRLEERKKDPVTLLAPALKIPTRTPVSDEKLNFKAEALQKASDKKGRLISRQI